MKLNLSYIAGFFEGEGCAGFYKNGNGRRRFSLEISQNNPYILYKIKDYFGRGHIADISDKRKCCKWIVSCNKGLDILRQLYPYLQFRKDEFKYLLKKE